MIEKDDIDFDVLRSVETRSAYDPYDEAVVAFEAQPRNNITESNIETTDEDGNTL